MRRAVGLLLLLAFLGTPPEARAGELASPRGFVITYPEGWKPATKEQRDWFAKKAGQPADSALEIILGPHSHLYTDNLSVCILPRVLAITAESEKAMLEVLKKGMGEHAKNFRGERCEIQGKRVLTIAFDNEERILGDSMRVWVVYIPGKEQTYVFTCTTLRSRWEERWPVFKEMVSSARIDVF